MTPYAFPSMNSSPYSFGDTYGGSRDTMVDMVAPGGMSSYLGMVGSGMPTGASLSFRNGPAAGAVNPMVPAVPTMDSIRADALNSSGAAGPGATPGQGWFSKNLGTIETVADIVGGLGKLYAGFQANKIAKQSLGLQRQAFEANLANSIKSYNTALEDRARARAVQSGQSSGDTDAYIAKNRL